MSFDHRRARARPDFTIIGRHYRRSVSAIDFCETHHSPDYDIFFEFFTLRERAQRHERAAYVHLVAWHLLGPIFG